MRRFLLVAHDAATSADFSFDDLAGGAGRMDIVARCVVASLLVSHGVRSDTEFLAVLLGPPRPPRTLRFSGAGLRGLNPDERSTAALVRRALGEEGLAERSPHPGIFVSGGGLRDALASLPPPILLDESGDELRTAEFGGDSVFVLSDHKDFLPEERTLIEARALAAVRVGPRALHADQVITVVHNELDRRG